MSAATTDLVSITDRRRRRLLHRIEQRYPTVTEELRFGEISLHFTRVADPDRVLDDIVIEIDRREKLTAVRDPDPPHLPYWAELWDSAGGIAAALTRIKLDGSTRVLDLGCGMGLSGAVAAALGARVLLADLESPALLFARLNCFPFWRRVRTVRLNWQVDRLSERFDLILGADILYERKQWEPLNEFWLAHLAANGTVLLGEPGRQSGEMFLPWIRQKGWDVRESSQPAPTLGKAIRIISLRRGS
jgi:predicted nicotinamide N-methyase